MDWISVKEKLPDFHAPIWITDGKRLAAAHRDFRVEPVTCLRGLVNGEYTPAFHDRIPNPKAGQIIEWWQSYGCTAFDVNTDTENDDGALYLEATHWMLRTLQPPT